MAQINFTSLHEIRREAGLIQQTTDTRVAGAVDGVNQSFVVNQLPIIDRNNDDEVTQADVMAFVDDLPVIVQQVEPATGVVVLASAPETGSRVSIAYEFSAAHDTEIIKRRSSAQSWLRRMVKAYYNLSLVTADNFPDAWEDAVRLRAAGMLQISDWGTNQDTDGSSKDGYKKIELATQLINEWIENQTGSDPEDPNAKNTSSSFTSDGDMVGRKQFGNFSGRDRERFFWNKR